ncbi:MAG TPA: 50S ribosomal protein L17 [Thermodesulfovibrionales bacterium]|nr:50S ribosomal protein L17 [Thermodesulfovibrionales bacterium]
MRHRVSGRLFGRTANQRKALLRGLMASLFEYQRIETTLAKAKEVKKLAERVITLGIKGDLNSKRVALARVPNRAAIAKLFNEIAPRFSGRNGGYLRLVHTRNRVNDAAPMAVLEFVDYEEIRTKKEEPKKEEAKEQKPVKKEQKAAQKEKKANEQKPAKKKKEEKKEGE